MTSTVRVLTNLQMDIHRIANALTGGERKGIVERNLDDDEDDDEEESDAVIEIQRDKKENEENTGSGEEQVRICFSVTPTTIRGKRQHNSTRDHQC
jgi:hypothetical protein